MHTRFMLTPRRFILLTAIFILTLAAGLVAQVPGPPGGMPTGSPRDKAIEDKLRSDEIERVKRDAEKPTANRPDPEFPRIKEDFEQIQLVNADVLQAQPRAAAPDYARLAEAAADVKKRAERLKASLFPPGTDKQSKDKDKEQEKDADGSQDLSALLTELDNAITGFVSNPMFQNLRVVEPDSTAKARRDLTRVIKLSAKIKQAADNKRKGGG